MLSETAHMWATAFQLVLVAVRQLTMHHATLGNETGQITPEILPLSMGKPVLKKNMVNAQKGSNKRKFGT